MVSMEELLQMLVSKGGSDLHVQAGTPPRIRISGKLLPQEMEPLTREETKRLIYGLLTEEQIAKFEKELELDFSFGIENLGRFRVNVLQQKGSIGMVIRLIPTKIRSFEELNLPVKILAGLCNLPKGLILVTGATGSGKSTTLAAMIDYCNSSEPLHIITVEDPIEFVYENKKSLIIQREIGQDARKFESALKHILRQDPDCVLIGEMRDLETIEMALTLSETGHLTFGTLHTSDAAQTMNRIIDVFPSHQQEQIRTQLAMTLSAVICQQLIPKSTGGRALAMEILIITPAVRNLIREAKIHQVYSVIQTSGNLGMKTMNQALLELYQSRQVTLDTALGSTSEPDELKRLISRGGA